MLKIWGKMLFSKQFKSIYKSFYYLKVIVTFLMSVFVNFLFIGLISILFTCSHNILKIQLHKQNLQFQHQIKF
jgi:hypothetical protein